MAQPINSVNAQDKKTTATVSGLSKGVSNLPLPTITGIADTLKKDSTTTLQRKRDIETTIKYSAEDSIILDAEDKTVFLYNDAKVEYGKMNLTAHTIDMDHKTNKVNATFTTDSTGKRIGVPIFKDGSDEYEAGFIKYNYKTKRGQVKGIVTKQGDAVIRGKVVKKEPSNTMFVDGAQYTTCDLREPHFCIKAMHIKVIPKKKIVTRAFNLQFDDVPTMVAFPFGLFPIPKRRGTGLIFPSYGESQQRGFFLSNLGFYWAVNDYIGFKILSDLYSVGGAGTGRYTADLDYKSRYSFQGKFNFSYSNLKDNPDNPITFNAFQQYWVMWNHSTLSKGTGRFSASVNAGSANYNRLNSFNVQQRQQANFTSNVTYSNSIKKTPFSYSTSARQTQNVSTGVMDFELPAASLNMNSIYPLKQVPFIRKFDVVKKLQVSYSGNFQNRLNNVLVNPTAQARGYELSRAPSLQNLDYQLNAGLIDSAMWRNDTARIAAFYRPDTLNFNRFLGGFTRNSTWQANHSVPISTTFKLFRYFNFTPNAAFRETWFRQQYNFRYNAASRTYDVDTIRSFTDGALARKYEMNGGMSMTTRIFGTFYIRKGGFEAVRHIITPTVGYSYSPVFNYYFQQIDTNTTTDRRGPNVFFDRFTGTRVADPSRRKPAETISLSLANTFEAKVKDKKDTTKEGGFKKFMLLDNLGFNTNYNLRADSFNLSNITMNARTKVLGILDININATFDPYYFADAGVNTLTGRQEFFKTRHLAWSRNPYNSDGSASLINLRWNPDQGLAHLTNMDVSISTSITPKQVNRRSIPTVSSGTDYQFFYNPNAPGYVDFSLPWSMQISYRMTYQRFSATPSPGGLRFNTRSVYRNTVNISGDVTPIEKWKMGYTAGYDFNLEQVTNTTFNITRDLHCWYATISIGLWPATVQYYLFTLGIKSPVLSDVKIPRRNVPYRD